MIGPKPLSAVALKILGAVTLVAIAGCAAQTLRIEGAGCAEVAEGQRSHCLFKGFRQKLADRDATIAERTAERDSERMNHRQTKSAYREAQKLAAEAEEARLALVTLQQKEITDATLDDYRRRITGARAAAERLRAAAAGGGTAAAGAGGTRDVPALPAAAGRAAPATDQAGLPAGADELNWRLIATMQANQLDVLIDWIEAQHAIDPNNPSRGDDDNGL
ncbi:conserved hypothetical protein [Altererythrobacter sp. B11]|uniref:hypothetical protein n=1 Tax=Altererythrobacter sp. B11 TaxID=2060312 RepID=UPI000DC73896|nr:hypothetical protein [Altererythrobacter sp. B11]BBC72933.1 conserved hypothetical protein [Altererythrobacter sp. B11]